MKQVLPILMLVFLSTSVFAQNRVVYGKLTVYDTYPVKNIKVTAKKAKTSSVTDSLGRFSIVCLNNDVIKIKPRTFQPVSKRIGPDTDSLFINLLFIDSKTNRRQAIEYGYINEEDLNYAVNNLEQKNNDYCKYTNIFNLIKALYPDVTVKGNAILIRGGTNSFMPGASGALFVVDGVVTNSIDWISPCEVKSVNLLKDSSAAIYGTRGGNGVVLIVLKH